MADANKLATPQFEQLKRARERRLFFCDPRILLTSVCADEEYSSSNLLARGCVMSKSIRLAVLIVFAQSLLCVAQVSSNVGVVNSTENPLQVAILHWYKANRSTQFPVGSEPFGVAFDGANIWVANEGGNSVTKLRANDGTNLGTFAVGTEPFGLAFDGANIWVANGISNTVTKLRASDGATLGTFGVGILPLGVALTAQTSG